MAEQQAWASLPPLFGYLSLPVLRPTARPLVVERDTHQPVITLMPLASGQVVLVGLDETWRWRFKAGAAPQERIWMQLLTELTEPPYAVKVGALSLDVEKPAIAPDEPVAVRIRRIATDGSSAPITPIDLRILQQDGRVLRQQAPVAAGGGRYTARITGTPPGSYTLEARAGNDAAHYPLRIVGQYESELENASGDRQALQALADASGGQLLTLEQVRKLPALVASTALEPRPVEFELWHSTYLFVFVVACFAAEWAIRKRLGLA